MTKSSITFLATLVMLCMLAVAGAIQVSAAGNQWEVYSADGVQRIGPIEDRTELDLLISRLDRNNIDYRIESATFQESLGFIVVTEPFSSRTDAASTLNALRDAKEKDYLYVGRGVYLNRISAGVFSSRSSAQNRLNNLTAKGFEFQIIERFQTMDAPEIVIESTAQNIRGVLQGEVLTEAEIATSIEDVPVEELSDGELRIEESGPEQSDPVQSSGPDVSETNAIVEDDLQTDESATGFSATNVSATTASTAEPATRQPPVSAVTQSRTPAVVRQTSKSSDSGWLWWLFVGVSLIIAGALAYYFLQRRTDEKPSTSVTSPETVEPPAPTQAATPDVPPQELILEYAESVLEGRAGDSESRSLTILGTQDTAITDLIQDLLFLTRLEEKQVTQEVFSFDSRSLVDGIINRLSSEISERGVTAKSSPSDNLPDVMSLDAGLLRRVLTILIQYAVSKTESGQIAISQSYDNGQLEAVIRFHPHSRDINKEIETIINPARNDSALNVGQRIKFGVVNRLATVMDGRIDAKLEDDQAIISFRCPATEVQRSQLVLPSGKTIDDLLEAEARAAEEVASAHRDAEARIAASEAREAEIEQSASQSIQELEAQLAEIERSSEESNRHLQSSEQAIRALQQQLDEVKEDRDRRLANEQADKSNAIAELESVNTALTEARDQLQKEIFERRNSEQHAQQKVSLLEKELADARTAIEQEQAALQSKEETIKAEADALRIRVSTLQQDIDAGQSGAESQLQLLRDQLAKAEDRINLETSQRQQIETNSEEQVRSLQAKLEAARNDAEHVSQEKAHLEERLRASLEELEQTKSQLTTKSSESEALVSESQQKVEALQIELKAATEAIELEKVSREQSERAASEQVRDLESQLAEATLTREQELDEQNEKISSAETDIEQLSRELAEKEKQLNELQATADDEQATIELDLLRSELHHANENLALEVDRRNIAESAAGKQISELIDELNLLKSTATNASKESSELEEQQRLHVVEIESKLSAAETALDEERSAKQALEQETAAVIEEMEGKLQALQAEHDQIRTQAERSESFGVHQTELLEQALLDAEQATTKGAAATRVAQHLKSRVKQLETKVEALESQQIVEPPAVDDAVAVDEHAVASNAADSVAPEDTSDETALTLTALATEPAAESEAEPVSESEPEFELELELELEPEAEPGPEPEPELEPALEPESVIAASQTAAVEEYLTDDSTDFSLDDFGDEEDLMETNTAEETSIEEVTTEGEEDEEEVEFQYSDKPIRSSRTVNNPVLQSMIVRFVDRLFEHIESMEDALLERDYLELVVSCNWVRGEANTLGFEVLNPIIDSIEQQLRKEKFSQIITHLSELRNMAERIEVKETALADAPIQYVVPAHAKNAVIYENFVSQLGSKLLEMEVAAAGRNTRQIIQLCKWIDRYGSKIKFVEVVDACNQLQEAIKDEDYVEIDRKLKSFVDLYGKIEIIRE